MLLLPSDRSPIESDMFLRFHPEPIVSFLQCNNHKIEYFYAVLRHINISTNFYCGLISLLVVLDFLQTNQQTLARKGYDVQSFIERPSSAKPQHK